MISYDDFKKVEIKAGKILSAEKVAGADKLLKLSVDFSETMEVIENAPVVPDGIQVSEASIKKIVPKYRQIVSGISMYFPDPASLVGKTCMFVTNLEPRVIRGLESQGMILAVSTPDKIDEKGVVIPNSGGFSLLEPNSTIPPGTAAK
jgi:tRNA-binding EMAP/Myf-like protein